MSGRPLQEARSEVASARMFGRKPKSWAVELVDRAAEPGRVAEARDDAARAQVFGREPSASTARTLAAVGETVPGRRGKEAARERDVADLRRCGLSKADAERAQAGLERGVYESFREAAVMVSMFPRQGSARSGHLDHASLSRVLVERRAATSGTTQVLQERRAPSRGSGRRIVERASASVAGDLLDVVLITAGQGSSGFYSEAVLQQAAADNVFHRGLHLYVDHPSVSQERDRPERSVRDLAGTLASDAVFRDGGLYAQASVLPAVREVLNDDLLPHIGLSIRGEAEMDGNNVTRILRADSVDFVTHAGRGGRVLNV